MSDVTLVLHPLNNEEQAFWLCQRLEELANAEIVGMAWESTGIAIGLALSQSSTDLLAVLTTLPQIAEAWEEGSMAHPTRTISDFRSRLHAGRLIHVALRPF